MRCEQCQTSGAPYEIIDGLCHPCTASRLAATKTELAVLVSAKAQWEEQLIKKLLVGIPPTGR